VKYTYVLRINCGEDKIKRINDILGIVSNPNSNYWEQILIEGALDPPVKFVDIFLNTIKGKNQELLLAGIGKDDISVWMYYEYDRQCNISFSPEDMKCLGDNQITLCISCWESGNKDVL